MGRIVKGLRTRDDIVEELRRRGWRVEVDAEGTRYEIIPPDDATPAEIEAGAAFFREVVAQAMAEAGYEGKVTWHECDG